MRVLIAQRSENCGDAVVVALRAAGFYHDLHATLADAAEAFRMGEYAAAVVDERLRDGSGLSWVKGLRAKGEQVPAIAVIASPRPDDRAAALDAGFDDCLSAPVHGRELASRLRAVLRRPREVASSVLEAGNLRLDTEARELWVAGQLLSVPRREMSLIELLMRRYNRVVTRAAFENELYGQSEPVCPNSLEVRMSRVRRHLAYAGANVTIQTLRGTGYTLQPLDAPVAAPAPGQQLPGPGVLAAAHAAAAMPPRILPATVPA